MRSVRAGTMLGTVFMLRDEEIESMSKRQEVACLLCGLNNNERKIGIIFGIDHNHYHHQPHQRMLYELCLESLISILSGCNNDIFISFYAFLLQHIHASLRIYVL